MARTKINIIVLDPTDGSLVEDAAVTIIDRETTSQAPVYNAEDGETTITQPLTTDAQGRVPGWVDRGQYEAEINVLGNPQTSVEFDSAPGGDGSVVEAWIANSAVTTNKLGNDAVSTAKIQNGAVSNDKLAGNITPSKLVTGSSAQILVNSGAGVPTYKTMSGDITIDNSGVTTIGDTKVTNDKLATNSVSTSKIQSDAVTDIKLASPNNGVAKPIHQVTGVITSSSPSGVNLGIRPGASAIAYNGNMGNSAAPIFPYSNAWFAVDNKTAYLQTEIIIHTNGVAPGSRTLTFYLVPVKTTGSSGTIEFALDGSPATIDDVVISSANSTYTATSNTWTGSIPDLDDYHTWGLFPSISGGSINSGSVCFVSIRISVVYF